MESKKNSAFMPAVAIAPGETIRENMIFLGMNQRELAARLDITTKHLNNIINGNSPITYETALKLESVIGPRAQFWMNLETNYQLNKARLEEQKKLEADLEVLKEIPYLKMSEFGWVKKTSEKSERVFNSRAFFGVAELCSIKYSYDVAFRKQKQINEISDLGVLAWIRKAELEGLNTEVEEFSRIKLKKFIPKFRELTMKESDELLTDMQSICAECGVALLIVPYLPKTYISGATIWRRDKAIIALSVMGKRADRFWFTFFHEIAHLIKHSNKEFHISYEKESSENEADDMASNYLIPEKQYNKFISEYDYKDNSQIVKYSNEVGIAPFVLLGRLQHDELLGYNQHNDLIPSFQIATT
jgi:HTH-type transcriptional regulator/antitoxin HigA